jgi:cobalt/nickel transport system ATP-binding protein
METSVTAIIEFEDVYYRYPGEKRLALEGLTLSLLAGEKIAIIGRNGSGKSTLFLHCNGLYRPETGVVRYAGRPLEYDRKGLRELRQRVGICFQNPDDQIFSASVEQDISFGPLNLGLDDGEARLLVQSAAEFCEITGLLDRPTHALSGGEKARVALAGVLSMKPRVLIVDELMANLDPWVRLHIVDIFRRLHEQGQTIILATHDLTLVEQWATFVVVMAAGRALFAGPLDELLASDVLLEETGLGQVWQ